MSRCQEIPQARVAAQATTADERSECKPRKRGSDKLFLRTTLYAKQQFARQTKTETTQLNSIQVCPIHAGPLQSKCIIWVQLQAHLSSHLEIQKLDFL